MRKRPRAPAPVLVLAPTLVLALLLGPAVPALGAAGPAAYPPLPLHLSALIDLEGGALSLVAMAATLGLYRLLRQRAHPPLLVPGLALALAGGPAVALLSLLVLLLACALVDARAAGADRLRPVPLLMTVGGALGLLPYAHPAGAAIAFALLPALALALPAPLIAGESAIGTVMVLGFPGFAASLAFGVLAFVHGASPLLPYASLLGLGPGDRGLGPVLAGALLALPAYLWLAAGWGRRRAERVAALAGLAPLIGAMLHAAGGGTLEPGMVAAPTVLAAALRPGGGPWLAPALTAPLLLATLGRLILPPCLTVEALSCWSP